MAVITPTIVFIARGVKKITWANLANGDTGKPVDLADFKDREIQFSGTFSTGGSISFYGTSIDDDFNNQAVGSGQWQTMEDHNGNDITKTAVKTEAVAPAGQYCGVKVTAGDGSTNITATLTAKRTK